MNAHPEIVPTLVDRIKQTLVGLKMPRAIKIHSFLFPNDLDAGPQTANHIVVELAGFSDGFSDFQKACAPQAR